jgi:hypothetical protein
MTTNSNYIIVLLGVGGSVRAEAVAARGNVREAVVLRSGQVEAPVVAIDLSYCVSRAVI